MKFDVLFTADHHYIEILLSSIYSFLLNSKLERVRIHIITSGFTKEDYSKVETVIKAFETAEVHFYSLEDYSIEKYQISPWHGTQISNARLFFEDIILPHTSNMDELLYLDSDTITLSSLDGLENYQQGIYACKDVCMRCYPASLQIPTYYNSGVLRINIQKWIEEDCQKQIVDMARQKKIPYRYPDQDLLNCALGHHISPLSISFNLPPNAYIFQDFFAKLYFNEKRRNVSWEEIKSAKQDPKILHSSGLFGIKPWHSKANPFYEEFMKYLSIVSPEFTPSELHALKKYLAAFPFILKTLLLSETIIPESVNNSIRKISLKMHEM